MLQVKNLHKKLNEIKIVNGISFEALEKKITALIGPDGSGKTAVLDIITGLERADQGKIIFDERDVTNMSIHKRVQLGMARVVPEQLESSRTVLENLIIAFDEPYDHFWKALLRLKSRNTIYYKRKLAVEAVLKKMGLAVHSDEPVKNLSIGQRKILAIAKAMITGARLIILDEPYSGLGAEYLKRMETILRELIKEGKTILIADHNMQFALDIADKIIVLNAGEEIAIGTPLKIKNNKKVLEAYNS